MIVVLARPRRREHTGVTALARREELQYLRAIRTCRIDAADDIMGALVVIHERDALADGDRDLEWRHS